MEAALDRFRAAGTQVLGVSVDSVHSHANWARELGGVSFPLLADFEPKGAVARSFGHYLADKGIADRATVVIDAAGVVRYSVSVTPAGRRDVDELVAVCEGVQRDHGGPPPLPAPGALPDATTLYVKSHCGPSRRTLLAADNLRVRAALAVANVTDDPAAAAALRAGSGADTAPCLSIDGAMVPDSVAICRTLADRVAPLPG